MKNLIRSFGLMILAMGLLITAGCGKNVTREANVSEGDYYSAEEFKGLSTDQRDAYCASLDTELASLGNEKTSSAAKADAAAAQLAKVQGEVKTAEADYKTRKAETDGLREEVDYYKNLPKVHVVEKGEFLQKISGYERIYADPAKWPRIYRANKGQISDPNLIYPGWELTIPRDWPSTWTVRQDEYLGKIAGYWEVYGDRTAWTRIYEANKGKISDADMIWPGWELTIPRD
jgi:nucleoid-associated protein YgaU